ncbi:protein root primordium defective 1 [Tanacetum coccineum]
MHHHHHFILLRHFRRPSRHYTTSSSSSVVSSINWVRDRALDHAVEKERDLKPMISLKNLIISQPSKTLPLSIIQDKKSSLNIPIRPIDFIRKYPSVFNEFFPSGISTIHPHVKLTDEIVSLDAEERLLFDTDVQKLDVANRLLKLLMIARVNRIPLWVIDRFKWDLGLPNDYLQTLVPCFPDYFQVNGNDLELVCWSSDLAVSVMESKGLSTFPVGYSRGFEVDNKFKKWVDDWQKLPYVSPYQNVLSGESDKWVVGLLHEVLHLLVPKKTDKDNLLVLGDYLGVRSRFKKALLEHPGIFYVSSKLHTHTVVLREAYKRDLLVTKHRHPVMTLRSSYIHLMNMVMEKNKSKNVDVTGAKKKKATQDSNEGEGEGEGKEFSETESEQEEDDSDFEDVSDSDSDIEHIDNEKTPTKKTNFEDHENNNRNIRGRTVKFHDSPRRNTPNSRSSENDGRRRGREKTRKNRFDEKTDSRNNQMSRGTRQTNPPISRSSRTESPSRKAHGRSLEKPNVSRTREGRF